jgi:PQ loop repeat
MAENSSTECSSMICDIVGLTITVLQVGQVVPQHLEMYADKSTAGVSPWLLCFGSLYSYLAFVDVALSGESDFACGSGPYRCFMSAQPFIQMLLSAVLTFALWFWFLRYFVATESSPGDELRGSPFASLGHTCYNLVSPGVFFRVTVFSASFVTLLACGVTFVGSPENVLTFAHICGHLSAVLNAVMWIPQIILTAVYGHRGALSIQWVIACIVMDVVYSIYLAEMGLDISVWLNNIPDGVQTSILLAILLYYERRDYALGLDDFGHPRADHSTHGANGPGKDVAAHAGARIPTDCVQAYGAISSSDART